MRLAFTVATPDTADPNMLALRGDVGANFAALARLGYHAAELMVRDPGQLRVADILRQAQNHGLTLPAVSTGQLRNEDGLSLCTLDDAARTLAIDRMKAVIEFAAALGAQVNIGTLRGQLAGGAQAEAMRAAARHSFTTLLAFAEQANVRVAIEPQCRYVVNWLNTVAEALAWSESLHPQSLTLLFDLYHAALEERSVAASLIRAFPHVSWVQVSDSQRHAPGTGHFATADFIRVLRALNYSGYISVECLQLPDGLHAATIAARTLVPLLAEA